MAAFECWAFGVSLRENRCRWRARCRCDVQHRADEENRCVWRPTQSQS